jgi:hypothetical protein
MTSTTWTSRPRRGETLRAALAAADARRDGTLPMDVDGVAESFGDELSLLGALSLRWHTRLAGRIERELMTQPMDLESAVVAAWAATAREMPGVLAILDRHRAEPGDDAVARVMATTTAKEHVLLAAMAGRTSSGDARAAQVGAEIADRARAAYTRSAARSRGPVHRADRPGGGDGSTPGLVDTLVGRLRSVLAAA